MTHQEAETLAARIIWVWQPERAGEVPFGWKLEDWGEFKLTLRLSREVVLNYSRTKGTIYMPPFEKWRLERGKPWGCTGRLLLNTERMEPFCDKANEELGQRQSQFDEFAEKWMSVFHRNCAQLGLFPDVTGHQQFEHALEWREWAKRQGASPAALLSSPVAAVEGSR